jgi:hypothetical protein
VEPRAAQTDRSAPAMVRKGASGARPIAAKAMGVDSSQTGLQHVTQRRPALRLEIGDPRSPLEPRIQSFVAMVLRHSATPHQIV